MKHLLELLAFILLCAMIMWQQDQITKLRKEQDILEHTFSYPAQLVENYFALNRAVSTLQDSFTEHLKSHIKEHNTK